MNKQALTVNDQQSFAVVVKRADNYLCVSQERYDFGAESLALAKQMTSRIEIMKKEMLAPLNDQVKEIRAIFAPFESKLESITKSLQTEMRGWLDAEEKKKRKLEAELRDRQERERQKQLAAIEAGKKPPKITKLPERLQNIEAPVSRVSTIAGSLSTRKTVKWRVTDLSKIPAEYTERVPSKSKLDEAAKQIDPEQMANVLGKLIAGIEFYVDTTFVKR